MKKVKTFSYIVLFMILSFVFSNDTNAGFFGNFFSGKTSGGGSGKYHNGGSRGQVGAPLDGGLLSILGAAGLGYYLIRRKNKKQEHQQD